jgi:hypothetical protein
VIARTLDFLRGIMAVPYLIGQTAELEAENAELREQVGRLDALEVAVADAEALVREFYTGPASSPATRLRPVSRGTP